MMMIALLDLQSDLMNEPLRESKPFLGSSKIDNSDSFLHAVQFPLKLHEMLTWSEQNGYETVVSWLPGKLQNAFKVHKKDVFVEKIMPRFFKQTQYKSFIRQLNLWDFERILDSSPNKGGYTHELFVRGNPMLCKEMRRTKIKGKNSKLLASVAIRKASREDRVESNRLLTATVPGTALMPSSPNTKIMNKEVLSEKGDHMGIFPFMGKLGQPSKIEPQEMKYVKIGMDLGRLISKGEWPAPAPSSPA